MRIFTQLSSKCFYKTLRTLLKQIIEKPQQRIRRHKAPNASFTTKKYNKQKRNPQRVDSRAKYKGQRKGSVNEKIERYKWFGLNNREETDREKKRNKGLRDLCSCNKISSVHVIEVPERERREDRAERLFTAATADRDVKDGQLSTSSRWL